MSYILDCGTRRRSFTSAFLSPLSYVQERIVYTGCGCTGRNSQIFGSTGNHRCGWGGPDATLVPEEPSLPNLHAARAPGPIQIQVPFLPPWLRSDSPSQSSSSRRTHPVKSGDPHPDTGMEWRSTRSLCSLGPFCCGSACCMVLRCSS